VRDLLSALFALLGETLQGRDADRQQLHDDGCVDVRSDTKREQRAVCERTARDAAHQSKEVIGRDRLLKGRTLQTGDGNVTADTEQEQQKKRHDDLLSDVLVPEGVF